MIDSWWNNLELISTLSTIANWSIAILGIVVLALGLQESKLQKLANAPREIYVKQKDEVVEALKNAPKGITICVCTTMHGDSDRYGRRIVELLSAAGYRVNYNLNLAEYPLGVSIDAREDTDPSTAKPLVKALGNIGIDLNPYVPDGGYDRGYIFIFVGDKP